MVKRVLLFLMVLGVCFSLYHHFYGPDIPRPVTTVFSNDGILGSHLDEVPSPGRDKAFRTDSVGLNLLQSARRQAGADLTSGDHEVRRYAHDVAKFLEDVGQVLVKGPSERWLNQTLKHDKRSLSDRVKELLKTGDQLERQEKLHAVTLQSVVNARAWLNHTDRLVLANWRRLANLDNLHLPNPDQLRAYHAQLASNASRPSEAFRYFLKDPPEPAIIAYFKAKREDLHFLMGFHGKRASNLQHDDVRELRRIAQRESPALATGAIATILSLLEIPTDRKLSLEELTVEIQATHQWFDGLEALEAAMNERLAFAKQVESFLDDEGHHPFSDWDLQKLEDSIMSDNKWDTRYPHSLVTNLKEGQGLLRAVHARELSFVQSEDHLADLSRWADDWKRIASQSMLWRVRQDAQSQARAYADLHEMAMETERTIHLWNRLMRHSAECRGRSGATWEVLFYEISRNRLPVTHIIGTNDKIIRDLEEQGKFEIDTPRINRDNELIRFLTAVNQRLNVASLDKLPTIPLIGFSTIRSSPSVKAALEKHATIDQCIDKLRTEERQARDDLVNQTKGDSSVQITSLHSALLELEQVTSDSPNFMALVEDKKEIWTIIEAGISRVGQRETWQNLQSLVLASPRHRLGRQSNADTTALADYLYVSSIQDHFTEPPSLIERLSATAQEVGGHDQDRARRFRLHRDIYSEMNALLSELQWLTIPPEEIQIPQGNPPKSREAFIQWLLPFTSEWIKKSREVEKKLAPTEPDPMTIRSIRRLLDLATEIRFGDEQLRKDWIDLKRAAPDTVRPSTKRYLNHFREATRTDSFVEAFRAGTRSGLSAQGLKVLGGMISEHDQLHELTILENRNRNPGTWKECFSAYSNLQPQTLVGHLAREAHWRRLEHALSMREYVIPAGTRIFLPKEPPEEQNPWTVYVSKRNVQLNLKVGGTTANMGQWQENGGRYYIEVKDPLRFTWKVGTRLIFQVSGGDSYMHELRFDNREALRSLAENLGITVQDLGFPYSWWEQTIVPVREPTLRPEDIFRP